MNRGLISGIGPELAWKPYNPRTPLLVGCSTSGGTPTQPLLGSSMVLARYRHDRQSGLVFYQGSIQFASDASFGSGEDFWAVHMPVPAYRSLGGADLPIGNGWAWKGSAGNSNQMLRCTLADPFFPIAGTAEDNYLQFFIDQNIASGTGSITSTNTTTTITHNLGATPNAQDIRIVGTSNPTNNVQVVYVTGITSTQFVVNVKNSPGTNPFNFSWKIMQEPNASTVMDLLVNSLRPLGPWASGYVLGWNVMYQARR